MCICVHVPSMCGVPVSKDACKMNACVHVQLVVIIP